MIQSASILPLVEIMDWGRAVPPSTLLTPVNLPEGIDVVSYRRRDQELAYRDLVLGALLTEVVIQVGDVWQFRTLRPQLPATVTGDLEYETTDSPTAPAAPGSTAFVTNSSIPKDAISTDQNLYARDLVLHDALRQAAAVLTASPLTSLLTMSPSDAWSIAEGIRHQLACAGFNFPLNPDLFTRPDRDLADRDNQLAVFISQLQGSLANIFARAGRLLVKPPGQEPETYALTSETDEVRIWSAFPLLPEGRLQVCYNKTTQTVTWLGEEPVAANPSPQALALPVAGGELTVLGSVPTAPDSEFYRQKAARLHTRPYTDRIIFQTSAPEFYLTSGGIYQPSSVLLPVPGQLLFSLPIVIPSGCVRIGLLVQPSRFISILGFLNSTRSANGTAVTLSTPGSVTYQVPLPRGRSQMQLEITDLTAATPAFDLEITLDDDLVFDGAFTFNRTAGTAVLTQSFELNYEPEDSAGNDLAVATATIVVRWLGGAGQFTLNRLLFTTPAPAETPISYGLQVQVGPNRPTTAIELVGLTERQDVVWFDTLVPSTLINPVLGITFQGGQQAALYVHAYDLRVFDIQSALPDPSGFEPHKTTLAQAALTCCKEAWKTALLTSPSDPRTLVDGTYTWDGPANARWLDMLEAAGATRLTQAFAIAGPGDIGRPALVPDGLVLNADDTTVEATHPLARLQPGFRTLQAWMLEFNPRVAGPDFWPQNDAGCSSDGALNAVTVTAAFDWALTLPATSTGYITSLTSVSALTGAPNGTSFTAYSIVNTGPSGGTVQQTVTLSVALANLNVGASYSLTLTLNRQLTTGGTITPYTTVVMITATATSMLVTLPAIVAPSGYQVFVQSVILS